MNSSPEIIIPVRILREFIQSHTEWNFVYGNDYLNRGNQGQSWSAKYEPNAYRVPTLFRFCSAPSLFDDGLFNEFSGYIDEAIKAIPRDKPIVPFPKIGHGFSLLNVRAPKLFAYLQRQLNEIKYPNIKINYRNI